MKEFIDKYGKWIEYKSGVKSLIEPSQLWYNENSSKLEVEPITKELSEVDVLNNKIHDLEIKLASLTEIINA